MVSYFVFYVNSVCVNLCVSASICIKLILWLLSFLFICFLLFWLICFILSNFTFLDANFNSNDTEKERVWTWVDREIERI